MFNAVRDTGDHGPLNGFNRLLQITTMKDPQRKIASYFPAISNLTRNFMIANMHAGVAFDHDDGSRCYHDTFNFEVFSGFYHESPGPERGGPRLTFSSFAMGSVSILVPSAVQHLPAAAVVGAGQARAERPRPVHAGWPVRGPALSPVPRAIAAGVGQARMGGEHGRLVGRRGGAQAYCGGGGRC